MEPRTAGTLVKLGRDRISVMGVEHIRQTVQEGNCFVANPGDANTYGNVYTIKQSTEEEEPLEVEIEEISDDEEMPRLERQDGGGQDVPPRRSGRQLDNKKKETETKPEKEKKVEKKEKRESKSSPATETRGRLECPFCNKIFDNYKGITIHIGRSHKEDS